MSLVDAEFFYVEPKPEPVAVDHGFAWIGQSWDHCDHCGRPVREHPGMEMMKAGASPFDLSAGEIVPFEEAARRMPIARAYGLLTAAAWAEGTGGDRDGE